MSDCKHICMNGGESICESICVGSCGRSYGSKRASKRVKKYLSVCASIEINSEMNLFFKTKKFKMFNPSTLLGFLLFLVLWVSGF